MLRRVVVALAIAALLAGCSSHPTPDTPPAAPSVTGIGDPYYPLDGGVGIDVAKYRIRDAYAFDTGALSGTTTLTITATSRLTSFSLDFLLPVAEVQLSTGAATYSQETEHELVITPDKPIEKSARFRVTVTYAGTPADVDYLDDNNWHADAHEVVTVDEPHMAPWWFPANDHPSDKARMDISITVPDGNEVVSNGALVARTPGDGTTTFRWRADEPMATYLAFFAAGLFTVTSGTTSDGIGWVNAVSQQGTDREQRDAQRMVAKTPGYVSWLASKLGPYPFAQTGGVISSLDVGFSLETQTRPVYGFFVPLHYDPLLVHELAHQWFGDAVSVERWQDVWLNEGFATYMQWAYAEDHGGPSAQAQLGTSYGSHQDGSEFWDLSIGRPDPDDLFANPVYERGAMTLQALRNRIGDDTFWDLLRTWVSQHKYANATTDDFIALAEAASGEDLAAFFKVWVYAGARPDRTAANGL
ncbi:MAG: M1 family metallopeptidase [Nocardioides sp.]